MRKQINHQDQGIIQGHQLSQARPEDPHRSIDEMRRAGSVGIPHHPGADLHLRGATAGVDVDMDRRVEEDRHLGLIDETLHRKANLWRKRR